MHTERLFFLTLFAPIARAVRAPRFAPSSISISAKLFLGEDEDATRASHVRYEVCRKARPHISGFACQLIGIIKKPHRRSAVARKALGVHQMVSFPQNIYQSITTPFLSIDN